MEICAFCGTPIAASTVYCGSCGKFTQPEIESEVKRVAADVVANGQRAEPTYRALAEKLPPEAIPHLKARIRDHATRLRGVNPSPNPSASPIKPLSGRPAALPASEISPAEAAIRKTMATPPSLEAASKTPAPLPPPVKPFDLSEFEAETQPGRALTDPPPSEEVIPAPPAKAVTHNATPKTASPVPYKAGPKPTVTFTPITFDHPERYGVKDKLTTVKVKGLSVTVTGGLVGAGAAIRARAKQAKASDASSKGLAILLTLVILVGTLTLGGTWASQTFRDNEGGDFIVLGFMGAMIAAVVLSPTVYRLLRGQRILINDSRVSLLADLLDSLQDDFRRATVTANLSGPQAAPNLRRKVVLAKQRPKHHYTERWLQLRGRSAHKNLIEVRITERCKVGMAYIGLGKISKKPKYKRAKSESRYIVQVVILPNAERFTTTRFTREAAEMLSRETQILQAEAHDDHVIVVAEVPHPPSVRTVGAVLHYTQRHIHKI